jgi:hypothetical protein
MHPYAWVVGALPIATALAGDVFPPLLILNH